MGFTPLWWSSVEQMPAPSCLAIPCCSLPYPLGSDFNIWISRTLSTDCSVILICGFDSVCLWVKTPYHLSVGQLKAYWYNAKTFTFVHPTIYSKRSTHAHRLGFLECSAVYLLWLGPRQKEHMERNCQRSPWVSQNRGKGGRKKQLALRVAQIHFNSIS